MDAEPQAKPRLYLRDGKVYMVRESPGADLAKDGWSEYATMSQWCGLTWTPYRTSRPLEDLEPLGEVQR